MLGKKRVVPPPNPGQTADPMPVPAVSYITTSSPLRSPYRPEENATIRSRSAVVNRVPRRNGWVQNYVYGDENMELNNPLPMNATGQVASTAFQPYMRNMWDWFINTDWYICYPAATVMNGGQHNLRLSFRSQQISTSTRGGPTSMSMQAKPSFKRVQNVPRYSAAPKVYNTTSNNY